MSSLLAKLTDFELEAFLSLYNYADGHARYGVPETATRATQRLEQYMVSPLDRRQEEIEREFVESFFTLAQQAAAIPLERMVFCGSASLSIEIVANYLRLNDLSVALIEPAFDNLADILKRHGVIPQPLAEEFLYDDGIEQWLKDLSVDAIFLVAPNNPTGHLFSESDFRQLIAWCIEHDTLLILDFTFRFFALDLLEWDQYALLESSGVRYITIEDTGKTWPTFELKVSGLAADEKTFPQLRSIFTDIFLYLSPLNLIFATEFVRESRREGLEKSVWRVHRTNRALLRKALASSPLSPRSSPHIGVEWVHIDHAMNDLELVARLAAYNLRAIPGRYFFWSDPSTHTNFIRFALMRDTDLYARGMELLEAALSAIFPGEDIGSAQPQHLIEGDSFPGRTRSMMAVPPHKQAQISV